MALNLKQLTIYRPTRFALVGVGNTLTNFLLLNIGVFFLHQSKLTASIGATTIAILISFVLNRRYVFGVKRHSVAQLVAFLAVSAAGALLVQNVVFLASVNWLNGSGRALAGIVRFASGLRVSGEVIVVNGCNVLASLCVMVWNYTGYSRLVFRGQQEDAVAESV